MLAQLSNIFRKKKKFEPLKRFASFVWAPTVLVFSLILIVLAAFSATIDRIAPQVEEAVQEIVQEFDSRPRHPLTGELIDESYDRLPQVFGVMVENSADAWPLSGVDDAFLVFEAPVEGNIPRFIAFFSEEDAVDQIGPVRSARPYYLDWNDALDAVYAHVGGAPEALELIRDVYDTIDLNQFYQSEYFWRDERTRYAPHNVYTSTERLLKSLDELKLDEPVYEAWNYKDDSPVDGEGKSIRIDWSSGSTYDVVWNYNAETNRYERRQGGVNYEANNVVVLAMDVRSIDNVDRKHIDNIGEGDALIVQDGQIILARWKKDDHKQRMRFYDLNGEEIRLNAGKTWVEIVRELGSVETAE